MRAEEARCCGAQRTEAWRLGYVRHGSQSSSEYVRKKLSQTRMRAVACANCTGKYFCTARAGSAHSPYRAHSKHLQVIGYLSQLLVVSWKKPEAEHSEWAWLCSSKTLFTQTGRRLYLTCQQGTSLPLPELQGKAQVKVWPEVRLVRQPDSDMTENTRLRTWGQYFSKYRTHPLNLNL
jgi:hypothetical protein